MLDYKRVVYMRLLDKDINEIKKRLTARKPTCEQLLYPRCLAAPLMLISFICASLAIY